MIKNDQIKITWDPDNTQIVINTGDNNLSISSNDAVIYCDGGIITANVTDQIYQDMYNMHVRHYFDTDINGQLLKLNMADQDRMFQMFTDYADLIHYIIPAGFPIIEHILGIPWDTANKRPHPGINFDYECAIIEKYDEWKQNKLK
jgi:hypothetical protein